MTEYTYINVSNDPDLERIHADVLVSVMIDKNVSHCRWEESDQILRIYWLTQISAIDKQTLDSIVSSVIAGT